MEQLSRSAFGAAETLKGLPETEDFIDQLKEIAERYETQDSVSNLELDADITRLKPIRQELFRRMTNVPG